MVSEEKKIRKLTWKYFLKQKLSEITYFFLIIFLAAFSLVVIVGVIATLGYTTHMIFPLSDCNNLSFGDECTFEGLIILGLLSLMLLALIGLVIGGIIYLIILSLIQWIKSNWYKAEEKAERELK